MTCIEKWEKNMNHDERERVVNQVRSQMSDKRFQHVLRVEEEAERLALHYQVDVDACRYAALLHDYAKEWTHEQYETVVSESNLDPALLQYGSEILHGPVGSLVAKNVFDMPDTVARAIYYHTIGHAEMDDVAKVLFIADYIERGRQFKGVDLAREIAYDNLDKAVVYKLQQTIQFLAHKGVVIYPETVVAYNGWINRLESEKEFGKNK